MSRQANNWLVLGASGSGKTHYIQQLVAALAGRYRYLVVVSPDNTLADRCQHHEEVGLDRLLVDYDPRKVAALVQHYRSVHFEVVPGPAEPFMDALGQACMLLGQKDAPDCRVLLVVLEARNYLAKNTVAPSSGMGRVEAEGRKYGVDVIKESQRLQSTGADALDKVATYYATRVVVCPISDLRTRERVQEEWPLPDPGELARPDVDRGWGGEYYVYDVLTGRGARIRRDPAGARYTEPLGEGAETRSLKG